MRLQLAFLPQWSLFPHNLLVITVSLHCSKSAFLVSYPQQPSVWIASYAMLPGLEPSLPPTPSSLHFLDDVVVWTALSICHICLLEVENASFL